MLLLLMVVTVVVVTTVPTKKILKPEGCLKKKRVETLQEGLDSQRVRKTTPPKRKNENGGGKSTYTTVDDLASFYHLQISEMMGMNVLNLHR